MKGLLIHDFYRMKRVILTQFNILFFFSIICLIILLGVKYGNLSVADAGGDFSAMLAFIFVVIIPLFAGLSFYTLIFDKFGNDLKGWNKYMFSLPVSNKMRLGSTFIIAAAASFVFLLLVLGFSVITYTIAGRLINYYILIEPIMFFCLSNVFSCIMVGALYILKSKAKTVAFGIILYVGISFGFVLFSLSGDLGELIISVLSEIMTFFWNHPWMLAVSIAGGGVLSYFISLAAINKRRDKLC